MKFKEFENPLQEDYDLKSGIKADPAPNSIEEDMEEFVLDNRRGVEFLDDIPEDLNLGDPKEFDRHNYGNDVIYDFPEDLNLGGVKMEEKLDLRGLQIFMNNYIQQKLDGMTLEQRRTVLDNLELTNLRKRMLETMKRLPEDTSAITKVFEMKDDFYGTMIDVVDRARRNYVRGKLLDNRSDNTGIPPKFKKDLLGGQPYKRENPHLNY
ncbi:MAG: hypothetical protein FWE47_00990 [Oscillospiraceae bacterium]|nr:hypothetical protein [Oscillospiraceae bacterium]